MEDVHDILADAESESGEASNDWYPDGHAAVFGCNPAKVEAEEVVIEIIDADVKFGIFDDFNYAKKEDDLNNERDERSERVILVLLVDFGFFFGDGIFITEVFGFDAINFGLHLDHLDRILLHPDGNWE